MKYLICAFLFGLALAPLGAGLLDAFWIFFTDSQATSIAWSNGRGVFAICWFCLFVWLAAQCSD